MAEYQENWSKLLSVSSSENRDSADSSNAEVNGRDEEFYEKIEAPKFVDFTLPDHYCPDDRYWFCLRAGCDQKHEKEMDSEAIYKNFVLRVMAARSPNVRLQKALNRNALRTPIKCPLSAPPKSSKPRISRMAIISSFSKKMVDDKKRVVRPLLKPGSTPVTKTKPVAAKYLTTPRNKKCIPNQNPFRSVQNPNPANIEVPKSRMVAKALVFHSPKKTIKMKTSFELRTPISKLCEGMNKLEITSQRKHALGANSNKKSSKNMSNNSSRRQSRRQLSSRKVQRRPEEPLHSQNCSSQEAKSGKPIKSKIKGKLSQPQASRKLLANDHTDSSKKSASCDIQEQLGKKVREGIELQESTQEEGSMAKLVLPSTDNSVLTSADDSIQEGNCSDMGETNNSRSQATNTQENNSHDGNENCGTRFTSESSGNSSEAGRNKHEFVDSDDKENAAAPDENRMPNKNLKQNGRKIFGMHGNCDQVKKKVTQAHDKVFKEGMISSGAATKLKTTNPKPFRLRTDERRILKEANLGRRIDPQSESANLSTVGGKLQRKQGNDVQIVGLKTPKGQERSKAAESDKLLSSPRESNAIQRLEKFRKMKSPIQKQSPQGLVSTKKKMVTFLIPGQKLDVINETSPQVSELKRVGKPTGDAAHSRSSSLRPVTVVPRSCTKKLK